MTSPGAKFISTLSILQRRLAAKEEPMRARTHGLLHSAAPPGPCRSFFERQSASSFIYRNCQSNLVDISEFDFLPRVAISVPKANFRFLWNGWPGARQPAGRRRSLKDKVGKSVADEKQGAKARQRSSPNPDPFFATTLDRGLKDRTRKGLHSSHECATLIPYAA